MAVIFLNRYFHPDHSATSQLLSDLAFALAADETAGSHAVHVVASRQLYDAADKRLEAREVVDGVIIHRVWTTRFGRLNLAGRALDYLTFYLSAALMLLWLTRRDDVVVAMTDPPMMSVLAGPVAWLKGARLVNWLQDVFPELAEATGLGSNAAGGKAYSVLRWFRNRSLAGAAMNVAIGDVMAERVQRFGIAPSRIRVIPNWSDGDVVVPLDPAQNALRREWGLNQAFVVGYSGNLGRVHEYDTFLDAIARLEQKDAAGVSPAVALPAGSQAPAMPRIVWLFVGGGALYKPFEDEVRRRRLGSVQFRPYQPRERLAESLSAGDVHLVSLRSEFEGLVVPSKYYGILAAGRPTLFVGAGDGEIARNLALNGTGVSVASGDGARLAAVVADLAAHPDRVREMGTKARVVFERDFTRERSIARWSRLFRDITGPAARDG